MSRMQYFRKRLMKMDWKAMWKTTGLLKKRSGKGRLWLMTDMLKCGIRYNAGAEFNVYTLDAEGDAE